MCAPFTGKDGDSPGFEAASDRARALTAAACHGSDPPLAVALPHTRAMQSQKRGKPSLAPYRLQIPISQGTLNNLIRILH